MKKRYMILLLLMFLLSGCKYSYGEYKHNSEDNNDEFVGVRLKIEIKDKIIKDIKVDEDTNYFYNVHGVWGAKKMWLIQSSDYIKSFIGKSIDEVLKINVDVDENGVPNQIDYDYISSATQSSGRFILALQDAIKNYNN